PQTPEAFEEYRKKRRCELDRFVELYKSFAADAHTAMQKGFISAADYPKLKRKILREGRRFELRSRLFVQPWHRRLFTFCKLYFSTVRPRESLEHLPYLLPRDLYCAAVTTRNRIQPCK